MKLMKNVVGILIVLMLIAQSVSAGEIRLGYADLQPTKTIEIILVMDMIVDINGIDYFCKLDSIRDAKVIEYRGNNYYCWPISKDYDLEDKIAPYL